MGRERYGPGVVEDGKAKGGVLRFIQGMFARQTYTQTESPTDDALGSPRKFLWLVDILDDGVGWGAVAQIGSFFGPDGVEADLGAVRYARDMTALSLGPIAKTWQLIVANTPGDDPDIVPSWGLLMNGFFLADGETIKLIPNDSTDGFAAFPDFTVYGSMNGGVLDGETEGYEHTTTLSAPFVIGDSTIARVAVDVRDVNQIGNIYTEASTEAIMRLVIAGWGEQRMGEEWITDPGFGTVPYNVGLRVGHMTSGRDWNAGVVNGSATIHPPWLSMISAVGSQIDVTASVMEVHNTSGSNKVLSSTPNILPGEIGQIATLVGGSVATTTIQAESALPGSGVRQQIVLAQDTAVDIVMTSRGWVRKV